MVRSQQTEFIFADVSCCTQIIPRWRGNGFKWLEWLVRLRQENSCRLAHRAPHRHSQQQLSFRSSKRTRRKKMDTEHPTLILLYFYWNVVAEKNHYSYTHNCYCIIEIQILIFSLYTVPNKLIFLLFLLYTVPNIFFKVLSRRS